MKHSNVPHRKSGALTGIPHGFFTRQGGVSTDPYATLNCATHPANGDNPDHTRENRRRATTALALNAANLIIPRQMHGKTAAIVNTASNPPEADALACHLPGVALGILTADCAPLLAADSKAGVIGAAHAGWRGAAAGVTDSLLTAMESLGASRRNITVAIGPAIAACSYEVGEDVCDALTPTAPRISHPLQAFLAPSQRRRRWMFDLSGYLKARLMHTGAGKVDASPMDCFALPHMFFSHRYAQRHGNGRHGLQLSMIALHR